MKKMNYVRPLAEVIELDAQDIIRTSDFSDNTKNTQKGNHVKINNGDLSGAASVNQGGYLKLQ